jgi:hypothetical protein
LVISSHRIPLQVKFCYFFICEATNTPHHFNALEATTQSDLLSIVKKLLFHKETTPKKYVVFIFLSFSCNMFYMSVEVFSGLTRDINLIFCSNNLSPTLLTKKQTSVPIQNSLQSQNKLNLNAYLND